MNFVPQGNLAERVACGIVVIVQSGIGAFFQPTTGVGTPLAGQGTREIERSDLPSSSTQSGATSRWSAPAADRMGSLVYRKTAHQLRARDGDPWRSSWSRR